MLNTTASIPTPDPGRRPTAKAVGDFRRELLAEGVDSDLVNELVGYAGHILLDRDGLVLNSRVLANAGGAS